VISTGDVFSTTTHPIVDRSRGGSIVLMVSKGMTLAQVKEARPTPGSDGLCGAADGSWAADQCVEAVYLS
jgi:hypothetical protein